MRLLGVTSNSNPDVTLASLRSDEERWEEWATADARSDTGGISDGKSKRSATNTQRRVGSPIATRGSTSFSIGDTSLLTMPQHRNRSNRCARPSMKVTSATTKANSLVNSLRRDDRFAFLLDNPPVLKRMEAILGTCVQLHSATARITEPGTTRPALASRWSLAPSHRMGTPYGSLPAQINCGYYLDAVNDDNGPHGYPTRQSQGTFPSTPHACRIAR